MREHRNDSIHEVDARAPLEGLQVDRIPGADEVADVGDMNADLPGIVAESPDGERVVVVFGVRRVDGEYEEVPPVSAMISRLFPPVGHGLTCRRNHVIGKRRWQPVIVDHRQNVDAGLTRFPEHRLDAAHGSHLSTTERGDTGNHHVTLLGLPLVPLSHQDFTRYPTISGVNDPEGAGAAKGADHRFVCAVQNLDHSADRAAATRAPLHTDNHLVAVHGRFQGEAGHEDVLPTLVRRDEPIPFLGNRKPARHQVDLLGRGVALSLHAIETPPLEHTSKQIPEIPEIPWRHGQPFRDLLGLHWAPPGPTEVFEDRVFGGSFYFPSHVIA